MSKEKLIYSAMIVAVIIVFGAIGYGGYLVNRWFNYEFGYESMVNQQICETVKPEALIDPSKCK